MHNILRAIAFGLVSLSVLPVCAMKNRHEFVSQTMVVNAPMPFVWEAIKIARMSDPAHRRVISTNGSDYIVEETFSKIPVLGNVKCRYAEHETDGRKVDYQMISSDKFIAFEGEWELHPLNAGTQTALTLSSFVDTGLPFGSDITRDRTKNSVATRLNAVQVLVDGDNRSRLLALEKTDHGR